MLSLLMPEGDWHAAGFDGTGVRVAIVDEGFGGHEALLGTALPSSVESDLRYDTGIYNHGTAVAELVHQVAPGAELVLVAFSSPEQFIEVVPTLSEWNVQVVVASVGFANRAAPDGSSPWTSVVDTLIAEQGLVWVNAAGNEAEHFRQGSLVATDGRLELAGLGAFRIWGQAASFRWTGPLSGAALVAQDEDGSECGRSGGPEGWIELNASCTTRSPLLVLEGEGEGVEGSLWAPEGFVHNDSTPEKSLILPADARLALSVGACDAATNSVSDFSSRGPTEDGRIKPDLCTRDGLETTTTGYQPFTGTSATAPVVGGLAALLFQAHGSHEVVMDHLRTQAEDLLEPGPDSLSGWGSARLGAPPNPPEAPGPSCNVGKGPLWLGLLTVLALRRRSQ